MNQFHFIQFDIFNQHSEWSSLRMELKSEKLKMKIEIKLINRRAEES